MNGKQPRRVLVLSFYFEPDLSAGSFRTTAFVDALLDRLPADATVDVLTSRPNRYHSFEVEAEAEEVRGRLRIRRIAVPPHQSGMLDQVKAYRTFAWAVAREVRRNPYDLVYATTSRLFTGFLGALSARYLKAPLYLDVRDIFNDTIQDVLSGPAVRFLMPALAMVERFTVSSARQVNLVSDGFLEYFRSRYPSQSLVVHPNGIDDAFLRADFARARQPEDGSVTVLYAGNIGQGQGLHRVIPEMARALAHDGVRFRVVGDGGARHLLEQRLQEAGVENVELLPPVPRERLLELYRDADVLFMHLNDLQAFHKVLPSKLFEYAATGKPVLAGVDGVARAFLEREVDNAATFAPCDPAGGAEAFRGLSLEWMERSAFKERFGRRQIMTALAEDVVRVGGTA